MKFNYIFTGLFFATALANLFSSGSNLISSWSKGDLEQFLQDRGLVYKPNSKIDDLRHLANDEWNKLTASQSSWSSFSRFWNWDNYNPALNYDSSYTDWVFGSWSKQEIYKFIHKYDIPLTKAQSSRVLTNDELIGIIKANWSKVTKKNKKLFSSLYPGEWLYQGWSKKSLESWLKEHDIDFNPKATREDLLTLVRKNIYVITTGASDYFNLAYNSAWDQINSLQSEFQHWTADDIKAWLAEQKKSTEGTGKELADRAHAAYVENKNHLDKLYYKISEAAAARAKKQAQLAADTGQAAAEGAKKHANRLSAYIFDTLSIQDLKLWLKQRKQSIDGTVDQLYERAYDTYTLAQEQAEKNYQAGKDNVNYAASEAQKNLKAGKKHADAAAAGAQKTLKAGKKHADAAAAEAQKTLKAGKKHADAAAAEAQKTLKAGKDQVTKAASDSYQTASDTYDASKAYFEGWSLEELKAWLVEHKQDAEGNFEELAERASSTFNSIYALLGASLAKKQKEFEQSAHHLKVQTGNAIFYPFHELSRWFYNTKAYLTGVPITPTQYNTFTINEGPFTRWYKHLAVNFRYYVLGQQVIL